MAVSAVQSLRENFPALLATSRRDVRASMSQFRGLEGPDQLFCVAWSLAQLLVLISGESADEVEEEAAGPGEAPAPTEPPVEAAAPTEPLAEAAAPTEPPVEAAAPTEPPVEAAAPTEPPAEAAAPEATAPEAAAPEAVAAAGTPPAPAPVPAPSPVPAAPPAPVESPAPASSTPELAAALAAAPPAHLIDLANHLLRELGVLAQSNPELAKQLGALTGASPR